MNPNFELEFHYVAHAGPPQALEYLELQRYLSTRTLCNPASLAEAHTNGVEPCLDRCCRVLSLGVLSHSVCRGTLWQY